MFNIQEKNIKSVKSYIEFVNEFTLNSVEAIKINFFSLKRKYEAIRNVKIDEVDSKRLYGFIDKRLKFFESLKDKDDIRVKFYYRGHYSDKYVLLPSAIRDNEEKENYFYNEIIIRNPNKFAGSSHLQKLVTMQHYECPTRLLDVTTNPLVALYFACVNTGCEKCNSANIGEVLIFAPFEKELLSFDSDKAMILSCLPKYSSSEKKEILKECYKAISSGRVLSSQNKSVKKLYHEIKSEFPAFENIIEPMDMLSSYFVQPLKDNNRIVKQDGAFIICGLYENKNEMKEDLSNMVVARIKVSDKKRILRELDALGINEATLFPEIDHVAHYLKNK